MERAIGVAVEVLVDETRPTNFVEGVIASALATNGYVVASPDFRETTVHHGPDPRVQRQTGFALSRADRRREDQSRPALTRRRDGVAHRLQHTLWRASNSCCLLWCAHRWPARTRAIG